MARSESADRVRRLIKTARQERGWTQADLAHAAGIKSRTTIQTLESGGALSEGYEGAIEKALGMAPGEIAGVRSGDLPAQPDSEPAGEPDPADYPNTLDYLNAVYWFIRKKGMSHAAVMRGFRMASVLYQEQITGRKSSNVGDE